MTNNKNFYEILLFISFKPQFKLHTSKQEIILLHKDESLSVTATILNALVKKNLVRLKDKTLELTLKGLNLLPEHHQPRALEISQTETDFVSFDRNESPLSSLMARKAANGTPFLKREEIDAGERIRHDFTRAMMMPGVSSNWSITRFAGVRTPNTNSEENITSTALTAREQFYTALNCLGSDLSGVVTDICCYLKGFEQVERERKWPKRSAKFMLKAALSVLAVHYNPNTDNQQIRSWGAPDYRPKIN